MKDRKSAVMAAIDDNWRQFRNSLDRLVSSDMSLPGVLDDMSVADVVGHITTWEWELVTALDRGHIEPVGDINLFNEDARQRKKGTGARRIVEDMERVHRSLRDELAKAPSAYFEPDDPFRELIDRCTVLHYQEHGTHIRVWTADKSPESTGG
ncbi:MAG: maleylpyruvate isomerase N-terminal domain-containing protein [Chloroflexota bacterium]|nr:maleylpyruvate isomerase N-terminal domain-containing protein [Chloroflexota bacterium]